MATNFTQNSQQASASILKKIQFATGLDNPTKSSKIGTVVDAIRNEVSEYSGFITQKINDMRYSTASERALDVIGASEEIYRNTLQFIDVRGQQKVAKIKLSNGATFDSVRGVNSFVESGSRFKLGPDIEIVFLDEVRLLPNESEVYFGFRLYVNPRAGGISIPKGRQLIVPLQYNEYANSNEAIVLEFDQPVRFDVQNSDDDFYRARIGAKKTDPMRTQATSLEIAVREVAGVQGVHIKSNMRGPGTIDIGFTTLGMMAGEDNSADTQYVKGAIESHIRRNYNYSSSVKVIYPTAATVIFEYRADVSISDSVIKDAIKKAFQSTYKYSNYNGFAVIDIEDSVKRTIAQTEFELVQVQMYDPIIDYIIAISSTEIIAPINVYMITKDEAIRRVE